MVQNPLRQRMASGKKLRLGPGLCVNAMPVTIEALFSAVTIELLVRCVIPLALRARALRFYRTDPRIVVLNTRPFSGVRWFLGCFR